MIGEDRDRQLLRRGDAQQVERELDHYIDPLVLQPVNRRIGQRRPAAILTSGEVEALEAIDCGREGDSARLAIADRNEVEGIICGVSDVSPWNWPAVRDQQDDIVSGSDLRDRGALPLAQCGTVA